MNEQTICSIACGCNNQRGYIDMDQAIPSHSTEEPGMPQWIHIGPATLKMYVLLLQKAYRRHAMREVKEVIDGLNDMLKQPE